VGVQQLKWDNSGNEPVENYSQGSRVGSCEDGNEPLGFIKGKELFD
jgi:hypothetical protein